MARTPSSTVPKAVIMMTAGPASAPRGAWGTSKPLPAGTLAAALLAFTPLHALPPGRGAGAPTDLALRDLVLVPLVGNCLLGRSVRPRMRFRPLFCPVGIAQALPPVFRQASLVGSHGFR